MKAMDKKSRIFPSWEHIDAIYPPLSENLIKLARHYDKYLNSSCEIYVRPYFNGDFPDLVLLGPSSGIVFIEVVEWGKDDYERIEKSYKVKGRKISYNTYRSKVSVGKKELMSPVYKVDRFRKELLILVPKIGRHFRQAQKTGSIIRTALYFPNMIEHNARALMVTNPRYKCFVMGYDSLKPDQMRTSDVWISEDNTNLPDWKVEWNKEIRFWLIPPLHKLEEGIRIKLTKNQSRYAKPQKGKHQRLMGVAGSGKTLVLAQRAAQAASDGKKVLIVTYNITLMHYIISQLKRVALKFDWKNITIKHFHGFCSMFLKENDISWTEFDNDKEEKRENLFKETIPNLVMSTFESGLNSRNRKYDAVYIDEGQDYYPNWYKCLCKFLSKNDEVLFVYDPKQNVYMRPESGDDEWNKLTLPSRSGKLKRCFRFPELIIDKANKFSNLFLPEQARLPIEEAQYEFPFLSPRICWIDVVDRKKIFGYVKETVTQLVERDKHHPDDIVILVPTHKEGWKLVREFEKKYRVTHVFEPDIIEIGFSPKQNKFAFKLDEPGLKMSTIHSFKGWELRNVILCTPSSGSGFFGQLHQLVYSSITRARENLIVINRNPDYKEYGSTWPNNL
tara:strand:- start:353 stop:2203 length:1851 start_codon:yes stop_codon:yes gene_type:complete